MNKYDIGRRIEAYRDKRKMSTHELAERINRSQATISRIENGKQGLTFELLSDIAEELRVHPFALLADEPSRMTVPSRTGCDAERLRHLVSRIRDMVQCAEKGGERSTLDGIADLLELSLRNFSLPAESEEAFFSTEEESDGCTENKSLNFLHSALTKQKYEVL